MSQWKLNVPLNEVKPAWFRRTATVIMVIPLFVITVFWSIVITPGHSLRYVREEFFSKCWKGE